jgi:hypothetical protein
MIFCKIEMIFFTITNNKITKLKMYNLINKLIKDIPDNMRQNLLNWNTISNASDLIGLYVIEPLLVITTNDSNSNQMSIKKITSSIYLILCIKLQLILNTINTSINIIKNIYKSVQCTDTINTPIPINITITNTVISPLQKIKETPKDITKKPKEVKEIKKKNNNKKPLRNEVQEPKKKTKPLRQEPKKTTPQNPKEPTPWRKEVEEIKKPQTPKEPTPWRKDVDEIKKPQNSKEPTPWRKEVKETKQPILISVANLPQITFDKNITDMNQTYNASNTESNLIQMIHNINYISLHQDKYLKYITKIHIIKGIHPTQSKQDHFTALVNGKSPNFTKPCHFNINNKMITEITYKCHKKVHIVKCIK